MARSIAVSGGHGDGDEERKARGGIYLLLGLLLLGGLWISLHAVKINSSGGCRAVIVDDEPWGELVELGLLQLGCTTELVDDCDDIIFRKTTTIYFVDEYGYSSGAEYCIPKILRVHIRPIVLMSAADMSHLDLPDGVTFLQKNGDVIRWLMEAFDLAGVPLP